MSDEVEEKKSVPCMHNQHHWDNGVRTEGVPGGYTFTCIVCKEKKTGWRVTLPGNAPDTRVRMSKKMRRKMGGKAGA